MRPASLGIIGWLLILLSLLLLITAAHPLNGAALTAFCVFGIGTGMVARVIYENEGRR